MSAESRSTPAAAIEDLIGPLNDVERKFAPTRLFVHGRTDLLRTGRRVSIVGSRRASELGMRRAARLSRILAEHGVSVVSGLAEGIDTAAHRSAMVHGGKTIAVIGTPLDQAYPRANASLQEEIGSQHLLVSQFAPHDQVQKQNFVLRNRTMALISCASVIIEAGDASGTLSHGWETLRLGRRLFVLRSVVENHSLEWPSRMLDGGAHILTRPEELLFYLTNEHSCRSESPPF